MFFFNPSPSLAAEKQGPALNFSSENETFKARMKMSSENGSFVRGGMFFFVRARLFFLFLWALRETSVRKSGRPTREIGQQHVVTPSVMPESKRDCPDFREGKTGT